MTDETDKKEGLEEEAKAEPVADEAASAGEAGEGAAGESEDVMDAWAAAMEEQKAAENAAREEAVENGRPEQAAAGQPQGGAGGTGSEMQASAASFNELQGSQKGPVTGMDMILDIPLTVAVELGRSKMIINDFLQLCQGSVIELEKLAGEPMEVLVNGKLVAKGEVVVVNEKFGVRLTDIISPVERVKQLR